jgi:hypothetical protein
MSEALASWHMGNVISAYRNHPFYGGPVRQEFVGGWMGVTQAQLSRIENGAPIMDLTKLIRWARTLRIPADLLWFKLPGADRRDVLCLISMTGALLAPRRPLCTRLLDD